MLVFEWKINYNNSDCTAVQIHTGLKLLNQFYLECLTQKAWLSQCFTLAMAFSWCAMWHQNAGECTCLLLQWYIHYTLAIKNIQSSRPWRMKIKISAWVKTPIFFHETGEYYTRAAIKAIIRHIKHSKPYSHKKFQGYGKVMFASFHLGLHFIHNSLQCFTKAFNPTSSRHTCMQKP